MASGNSEPVNDPDGIPFHEGDVSEQWDAHDARRQHDQMAPPQAPCECYCLHCQRTFMSDLMWFQRVVGDPQGFEGFWMCPTPNCGGAGFTFDIFPTDPAHPANAGWHSFDEIEDEFDEDNFDDAPAESINEVKETDWDPAESKYKAMEQFDDEEDDLEGEEWKYGLEPGQQPPDPSADQARRQWEAEQRQYDQPDQRPRELDWTDREDRPPRGSMGDMEDDIPF
jgi:hypothetical protein